MEVGPFENPIGIYEMDRLGSVTISRCGASWNRILSFGREQISVA